MKVFVTGATGFVGYAVIKELIGEGHAVLGLSRSDTGAKSLLAVGAVPHRGDIEDLDCLRSGISQADAVIHMAFNHDFSKFAENCEADRHAITAMGQVLVGTEKPYIVTSGTGMSATENDPPSPPSAAYPRASEQTAIECVDLGVRASVVRLPQVHDENKQGLITYMIAIAKAKGISAYVGDGSNCFPAVHLSDAALLYRLALENGATGARYHAIGEEGVSLKEIAGVIGRRLNIPVISISAEQAFEHFGWMGLFATLDLTSSSKQTQEQLGWHPTGPGLLHDLNLTHDLEI